MADIIVKNINEMKNPRVFLDGSKRAEVVLETLVIGKGVYLPGWVWSLHAGAQTGKSSQTHIGYIISGQMVSRGTSGEEVTVGPGDAFEVGPNHDAWVLGDEPCVALDFNHISK